MRPHTPRRFGTKHVPLADDGLPADARDTPREGARTPRDNLLLAAYAQLQQEQHPPTGPSVVPWRPPTRSDSRCAYLRAAESPSLPVDTQHRAAAGAAAAGGGGDGGGTASRPSSATCQTRRTPMCPPKGCPFSKLSPRTSVVSSRNSGGVSVLPRIDDDNEMPNNGLSSRFSLIDLAAPPVKGSTNFARTPSREQDAFAKGVGQAPTVMRLQEMINSRSRPGGQEGRNEALEMLLEDYNNMVMGHRQESTIRAKAAMRNNHRFQRFSMANQAKDDNVLRPRMTSFRIIRPKTARRAAADEKENSPTSAAGTNSPRTEAAPAAAAAGFDFYVPKTEVVRSAAKMSRTTGRGAKIPGTAEPRDTLCFAVPAAPSIPRINLKKMTPRVESPSTKYRGFLFSADDMITHTRPRSAIFAAGPRNDTAQSPSLDRE